MNASSKKSIPVSAYDRSRLYTEHTTCAQAAENILDASSHIPLSNPVPTNKPERQTMKGKSKLAKAEGSSGILQRKDPLPFDIRNEYATKTNYEQKLRQNYVAPNIFLLLPALKNLNEVKH